MSINNIIKSKDSLSDLLAILNALHKSGPDTSEILEKLTYYKLFHAETFSTLEERILSALGLFYKVKEPVDIYSFLLSGFGKQHKKDYGEYLTPVQASVRRAVDDNRIISISAPTSAGKSYSIRDFIAEQNGDAVVIVPSRALIAEYINVMKRKFDGNKGVMISPFVDLIFTDRPLRRIFILTPERARDLFSTNIKLNIKVFFFDEAQISEEKERGIIFDVLIRRIQKHFPTAKLIFAHPFVENPEAQLKKHNFPEKDGYAQSYTHGSVGKACIFQHSNSKYYYFSPNIEKGYLKSNCTELPSDFGDFAFNEGHSVLIYTSKNSIYDGSYLVDFIKYIDNYQELEDENAQEIINTIADLLGANQSSHYSNMVSLLNKGVVIHHGSVPLEVRFLIEEFIRKGYAKICFATSTLAQGVNMPFDIVWLDNMRFLGEDEAGKALAFKNLIGRSGRLSLEKKFDFGYVFTKNPKLFIQHYRRTFRLNDKSLLDLSTTDDDQDTIELIQSIKNGSFNDDKNIPQSKVDRLSNESIFHSVEYILSAIYQPGRTIKDCISGAINTSIRDEIRLHFLNIFETSINRRLFNGEWSVFKQAISIFLQTIQGRSFKEIVSIRYNQISNRAGRHQGLAAFSQPASKLPNSKLINEFSIFPKNTPARNVTYDSIVFDTYDYLDHVISFSLSETFIATFKIYFDHKKDDRALKMIELLRFGTNNSMNMLLMRYGFPAENVVELSEYILSINENNIIFKKDIEFAPEYIKTMTEWYMP